MTAQADPLGDRVTRIESILEHMATKADLAHMEARITRWTVAAMFTGMAAAAAIAAAVAAIAA